MEDCTDKSVQLCWFEVYVVHDDGRESVIKTVPGCDDMMLVECVRLADSIAQVMTDADGIAETLGHPPCYPDCVVLPAIQPASDPNEDNEITF